MGKIKIYEIAKKLNLTSKEVLDVAKELNIDVKSHLSGVGEDEASKIESKLKGNGNKEEVKKLRQNKKVKKMKKHLLL